MPRHRPPRPNRKPNPRVVTLRRLQVVTHRPKVAMRLRRPEASPQVATRRPQVATLHLRREHNPEA
jgi:hypothetical protein